MGDLDHSTTHSPDDVALGRLLIAAGQCNASKVIGAYRTELEHAENITALEQFTIESYLKPCAEFLGIPATLTTGILKRDLCDLIILYIESFFPIDCSECSQTYTVDIEAETDPLLSCFICHQGSHDCNDMKVKAARFIELEKEIPSGCAWLCSACFKKNHVPSAGRHTTPPPQAKPPDTKSNPVSPELPTQRETAGVCSMYKLGTCPHGISGNRVHQNAKCQFNHPKRCRAFCRNGPNHKYGCSQGSSCPKFHPTLCAGSLSSKECFNESCTSTHLKGTRRKRGTQSRQRKPSNPKGNSNTNKRANTTQQKPQQTKPVTPANSTPPDLTFLVNTVQTLLQPMLLEITNLKQDMIRSGRTHLSSHLPPHLPTYGPSHQPVLQHTLQPHIQQPSQTSHHPNATFSSQRPTMLTQQQIHSSQPLINSSQLPLTSSQPPQPFQMSRLLSC